MILSEIRVYGVTEQPSKVTINDQELETFFYDDINMVCVYNFLNFYLRLKKEI